MADATSMALASVVLRALGGPSAAVTGQKSFLPADDRVGSLLKHITPSMMARLAREAMAQQHACPRAAGTVSQTRNSSSVQAARGRQANDPARETGRAGRASELLLARLAPRGAAPSTANQFTADEPCQADTAAKASGQGRSSPWTMVRWSWQEPLPAPAEPQPQVGIGLYPCQDGLGAALDLVA